MSLTAAWFVGLLATFSVVAAIALAKRDKAKPDLGGVSSSWLQEQRVRADDLNH